MIQFPTEACYLTETSPLFGDESTQKFRKFDEARTASFNKQRNSENINFSSNRFHNIFHQIRDSLPRQDKP